MNITYDEYKGRWICTIQPEFGDKRIVVKANKDDDYNLHHGHFTTIHHAKAWIDSVKEQNNLIEDEVVGTSIREVHMVDIRSLRQVEVLISENRKNMWINSELGCLLRIQDIGEITVNIEGSESQENEPKVLFAGRKSDG